MYRIGQMYKIELKRGIYYTAIILEEDDLQIDIKTIKEESIVLNKDEIRQSKRLAEDVAKKLIEAERYKKVGDKHEER